MSRTIGYIVIGDYGIKSLDNNYKPEGARKGTLMNGGPATLFETRARAKGAIERTIKHAEEEGQSNNKAWVGGLRIHRVVSEPVHTRASQPNKGE